MFTTALFTQATEAFLEFYSRREIKVLWVLQSFIHIADQVIRQADDPLPRAPKTFAMKRGIGNRYPWPPCTRYGCGKREMFVRKDAVPNGFLATKIRQLQRKREQKLAEPPCSRYGCGKRKWSLLNDFKSTGVIKEVCP